MSDISADARRVGLDSAEVRRRLQRDGPNRLPPPHREPAWRKLVHQLTHFFAVMLWVAGGLAIIGGLPQLGVAVFVVIVVNGVFAFAQEARAERAGELLRDLLPVRATVIRDGQVQVVDAADLVVGDLVIVEGGDRVSADLRCLEADGLSIDRSTLTGESVPEYADVGEVLHAGSFVVEGTGLAEVAATGGSTRLAAIAHLVDRAERPDTPLTKELHRLVRTIATIAALVGAAFFGLSLLLGTSANDGFIFAVGVTVALVPEGLLPTVTLSLAVGAQRMSKRNALVRRLESVETLGSTTFICTDKTGTLTQNRMSVVEVWTPDGTARLSGVGYRPEGHVDVDEAAWGAVVAAAVAARACSTGHAVEHAGRWEPVGDPMEAAIDTLVARLGAHAGAPVVTVTDEAVLRRRAFDPRRRRASVVTADAVYVKGAPDAILPLLTDAHDGTARAAAINDLTARGLRVLAVARRSIDGGVPDIGDERDLELLGLLGLEDPPRAEAFDAVAACRLAGIRLAMVTGDHPNTAMAIADAVGLRLDGAPVLTGAELPDDDEVLGALLDRDGIVIARVEPEDKVRIAHALRLRGHVVAMTGDGVNDGPALREADIGIAMGASGTDVARDAADLVLLDDDFGTIVAAVEQGRATYSNARQFLTYHLTDNVAELTPFLIWALSGGRFPLALGVLQILALDLGTDTFSAAALGAEPSGRHVLAAPPSSGRLLDRTVAGRAFGVFGPIEAAFSIAAFLSVYLLSGWRPGNPITDDGLTQASASGAAFLTVVIGQTFNAFACRSRVVPAARISLRSNQLLVGAAALGLVFALVCFLPAIASLLDHRLPPAGAWPLMLAVGPAILVADLVVKRAWRRPGDLSPMGPAEPARDPAPSPRGTSGPGVGRPVNRC